MMMRNWKKNVSKGKKEAFCGNIKDALYESQKKRSVTRGGNLVEEGWQRGVQNAVPGNLRWIICVYCLHMRGEESERGFQKSHLAVVVLINMHHVVRGGS